MFSKITQPCFTIINYTLSVLFNSFIIAYLNIIFPVFNIFIFNIRKNLITVNMGSSLVNDHDNVNDMIKNLIAVAELLYGEKDTILNNGS